MNDNGKNNAMMKNCTQNMNSALKVLAVCFTNWMNKQDEKE